jgi:hypothetical protein
MNVIELSTGHVFAAGSVRVVGPLQACLYDEGIGTAGFTIIGVGFDVKIFRHHVDINNSERAVEVVRAECAVLRQEAIDKLLGGHDG